MESIFRYLLGTKYKGLVFNIPKKMVVDFYVGADFAVMCGYENPQDPICARSRTVFVETFSNCPLL